MPERTYHRSQTYLLPPSTDEWVSRSHPVRFIAEVVESLTDAEWEELGIAVEPDPRGAPRYAPEVLLAIWLAGFTLGIRTTRKLEYACRYDLAFLWLAGGAQPDHNTLWRFYAEHQAGMRVLLKKTVTIAVEAELLDLALQAVDGTKVLANAAKERSLTPAELAMLEERLDAAIAALESQQAGDDEPVPPSLPEELRTADALRQRVQRAREQVASTGRSGKVNLTDPQARGMKTRQGLRHGYNAQAVVVALDPERSGRTGRMILATEVTTAPDDHGQLAPMIAAAQIAGAPTPVTVADGGYHAGETLAACAEAGYVVAMPEANARPEQQHPFHKDCFAYDPQQDVYTCPHGHLLTRRTTYQHPDGRLLSSYRAPGAICRGCPVRTACVGQQRGGKVLNVSVHDQHLRRHRMWMETAQAQQFASRRMGLIEGVFGTIKEQLHAHRFLRRGRTKVDAEWTMLAVGYNLRTLARVWAGKMAGGQELRGIPATTITAG